MGKVEPKVVEFEGKHYKWERVDSKTIYLVETARPVVFYRNMYFNPETGAIRYGGTHFEEHRARDSAVLFGNEVVLAVVPFPTSAFPPAWNNQ